MTVIEIQDLYCKWCPNDCEGLTDEERHGCVASGGFADDLEALYKGDEDGLLTKEQMAEINNAQPSEAKYGDVFKAITKAQQALDKKKEQERVERIFLRLDVLDQPHDVPPDTAHTETINICEDCYNYLKKQEGL